MKVTTKEYLEDQLKNFKQIFVDSMAESIASYIVELQEAVNTLENNTPKKVSDLTNDRKYQTETDVATKIAEGLADIVLLSVPESMNTLSKMASVLNTHSSNNDIHVTATQKTAWSNKAETNDIPTKVSDLNNDSNYQTGSQVSSSIEASMNSLARVATSGSYTDLTDKPIIDASFVNNSTNAVQSKVIKSALDSKMSVLVDNRNITFTKDDNNQVLSTLVKVSDLATDTKYGIIKVDTNYLNVTNGVISLNTSKLKNNLFKVTNRNLTLGAL